jgi:hypothetical protein
MLSVNRRVSIPLVRLQPILHPQLGVSLPGLCHQARRGGFVVPG